MPQYIKNKIRPPIKTHGGKSYLCRWIIDQFPENYHDLNYCEPFCAGASVFFNKIPSKQEVISDLDSGAISVLKALRDEPQEFIARLKRMRYTERTFKMAQNRDAKGIDDYIDHAVNEFVLRRMSRGGMKKAFAWSDRLRGGQPGDVNAWETILKQLPSLSSRLQNTTILCADFKEIMPIWDEEDTLIYLDPPYLHSTRSDGATDVYEKELSVEDHIHMLQLAKNARGKVIISGYPSPLYNRTLKSWKCKKKIVANNSGQTKIKEKRTEVLWVNF